MKASAVDTLSDISALEHLGEDWRPSFVIDLSDPAARCRPTLKVLHANASLQSSRATLDLLEMDGERALASEEFVGFNNWILNAPDSSSQTIAPSHQYGGVRWTYVTLRHRFRFVSGDNAATLPSVPPDELPQAPGTQHPTQGGARARGPEPADGPTGPAVKASPEVPTAKFSFDWTRIPLTDDVPEHIRVARSVNWASSPLGPIEFWSSNLRILANLIMATPHPAALYWGPKNVAIYNEACVELAGQQHPSLLGRSPGDT